MALLTGGPDCFFGPLGGSGGVRAYRSSKPLSVPRGARGPSSGRPFNPATAGGPVRSLSTTRVRITHRGVDTVERHLARFGDDAPNAYMLQRLRGVASGKIEATTTDVNFYTHELREYVRHRRLGWKQGQPADPMDSRDLWNDAHTATLEDYGLRDGNLYHPDAPQ